MFVEILCYRHEIITAVMDTCMHIRMDCIYGEFKDAKTDTVNLDDT